MEPPVAGGVVGRGGDTAKDAAVQAAPVIQSS